MKKKLLHCITGIIAVIGITSTAHIAHAGTIFPSSIGSTIKNAVTATKENATKNSSLRNQLVIENSDEVFIKEKALVDQLTNNLLDLENIQTRIADKAAVTAASGIDTSAVNVWLATSSSDIIIAQNDIEAFALSTPTSTSSPLLQNDVKQSRMLANTAISDINTAHNDLQSALDALMSIL